MQNSEISRLAIRGRDVAHQCVFSEFDIGQLEGYGLIARCPIH